MEEIYRRYYQELVYFALKFIRDKQAAEDIVIDCFIKFTEHNYGSDNTRSMLYIFVKNRCIVHLRALETHATINRWLDTEELPYHMLEADILKALTKAIDTLPADSKQVIDLYFMEEKSCVEIGHLLHKPAATIRSIKRYALNKLLTLMQIK